MPNTITPRPLCSTSGALLLILALAGCGSNSGLDPSNGPAQSELAPNQKTNDTNAGNRGVESTSNGDPNAGGAENTGGGGDSAGAPITGGADKPGITGNTGGDENTGDDENTGGATAGAGPAGEPNSELQAVCAAAAGSGACEKCVCESCQAPLETCADTAGCLVILECVQSNGCSGLDCWCGDVPIANCVLGEGNGPCRDEVLAAPGGKAPTLADPSGGPAADAAAAVGDCSSDPKTCGDACATN